MNLKRIVTMGAFAGALAWLLLKLNELVVPLIPSLGFTDPRAQRAVQLVSAGTLILLSLWVLAGIFRAVKIPVPRVA